MAYDRDDEATADTRVATGDGDAVARTVTAAAGAAAPPAARERQRVGRYRLLEQLGAGGMGQVFRARDPNLNRAVAINPFHFERLGIEHIRAGEIAVNRAAISMLLERPARFGARLVPTVKDGELYAYKVFAVQKGMAAARLGLDDGDTLIAIDDRSLADLTLEGLGQHLAATERARLSMKRRGEPHEIVYELRD